MNITISVPVHIDEPITASERKELRAHLQAALHEPTAETLRILFDPEPRMLGTVCRFRFGEVKAKVE